ncbi:cytochrome c [Shimia thalassica]|uniref:Cytochrome c n=1 Tax=Shimia thalassica TaxID=1715693 RepID=A0A0P1IPH1_9RHOB|nr:cytochrome c [Shimia thalassica]MDO6485538.1 cytochrome c [Shimia thalassica]MDP2582352.1 cytochrome c [Shimia thalassica]CUK11924.1 Cytochrome c' precursor [Shimia thalassica]
MRYALIAALIAAPALSLAGPAEKTVEARQGYFKLLGANMGVLAGMAQGKVDYDADAAQTAADNMVVLSTYKLAPLFAPGTSSDDVKDTRALPAIWKDLPGVTAKASDFGAAARAMQDVAGKGKGEMAGALGALGGSCKGCHTAYRAE